MEASETKEIKSSAPRGLRLRPARVLVIDDDIPALVELARLIDREAPSLKLVGVARSIGEALDVARQSSPDVIVLDAWLGELDALPWIPRLHREMGTPVVALSDTDDPDTRARARRLGAFASVGKSDPAAWLLAAIDTAFDFGSVATA